MINTIKISPRRILLLAGCVSLVTACTVVGPDYVRPAIKDSPSYKETGITKTQLSGAAPVWGQWWKIYGDSQLDVLAAQVATQNQTLHANEARARRARALVEMARAAQSPTVAAGGTNDLGVRVKWEIDLWGRIQRNIEASGATAQASEADLAAATLSMQAQVVENYFMLRMQDAALRLLQDTVAAYERSLQILRNQYAAGIASRGEMMQAQAQLNVAQVQMHSVRVTRTQLEHAIAILIGKAPADFFLTLEPFVFTVPEIPPALPADLLKRRPDIAAAERRAAAASARIGVAEAEFYPSLDLFAGVSIRKGPGGGATINAPLYSGASPQVRRTEISAAYDEAVAEYRQTVLNGFREVEDNLAALQILGEAATTQAAAIQAARETARITNNQYQAGLVTYLSVAEMQVAALNNERAALDILNRRLAASVGLIKALGGGWDASVLKTD